MRRVVRFLLLMGLLLSAGSVAPLAAVADPSDLPASSSSGPSEVPTDGLDPSGTASSEGPSDGTTTVPDPGPTATAPAPEGRTNDGSRSLLAPSDASTSSGSPSAASSDSTLVTTITRHPASVELSRSATFEYEANRPGVQFRCRLRGRDHSGTSFSRCPATGVTTSSTTGSMTYSRLSPSTKPYTFSVRAYVPGVPATAGATPVPETQGQADSYKWRVYSVYSPSRYSPHAGARFNAPLGSYSSQRRNLTHVIKTIKSMPGYREGARGGNCPTKSALWPSTIRISLYSMVDGAFSKAARAASKRCVSVQILMNNHLSPATDYSWKQLEQRLGNRVYSHGVGRRSFAHRCSYGCRGHGVLHTKMYLFDSQLRSPATARNTIKNTVMVGSSNITSNASKVQWNDLFTIRGNASVHRGYAKMFSRMKRGHKSSHLYTYRSGAYNSVFWPQGSSPDPYRSWLGNVRCTGASGGSGINGRTVIYVNMHAWFGTRGLALARQLRGLYKRGCYVRVLYGFMSFKVFTTLHRGTGGRMSVRRTLFSHNGRTAYLYTHLKNIDISGNFGGDSSSWLVSTGSNNFTNEGTHFDEVALRIRSRGAYNAYVRHFKYMSKRKSSSTYANYSEPTGGGRAP